MNKRNRAILYGLAIGDGHISYRTRYKSGKYRYEQAELIIGHGPKQLDYLTHKRDLLLQIFGGKPVKIAQTKHFLKAMGKEYTGYRIAKTNPYFRQMHKALYSSGKKLISSKVLSYLNEESLAFWFMDDGNILANKNKAGENTSLSFRICAQFPTEEEAMLVASWLNERFSIKAKHFKSKDKWDIGGATAATIALVNTVQDHIHPSMIYKILPAMKFVFRKSTKHPNFLVGDDIVQSTSKGVEVVSVKGLS